MGLGETFKQRVPLGWAVVSIAVIAIAVGTLAVPHLQAQQEESEGVATGASQLLAEVESILRDDTKAAQERIDEALARLEKPRADSARDPSPFSDPLFGNDWDPFREMSRMQRDMDRLFENAFARLNASPDAPGSTDLVGWSPQGEFEETEDSYIYRFDLPGVEKGEVHITVEEGNLILEGTRESRIEETQEDGGLVRREIRHGHFHRVTPLPRDVDVEGEMKSKLEDGVLTVTLPKLEETDTTNPKKIEIE